MAQSSGMAGVPETLFPLLEFLSEGKHKATCCLFIAAAFRNRLVTQRKFTCAC